MYLKEYLTDNAINHHEFAYKIGISPTTLSLILNGKNTRLDVAIKIYQGTNKTVTPQELYEEIKKAKITTAKRMLKEAQA